MLAKCMKMYETITEIANNTIIHWMRLACRASVDHQAKISDVCMSGGRQPALEGSSDQRHMHTDIFQE